jgi:hypothetical protein
MAPPPPSTLNIAILRSRVDVLVTSSASLGFSKHHCTAGRGAPASSRRDEKAGAAHPSSSPADGPGRPPGCGRRRPPASGTARPAATCQCARTRTTRRRSRPMSGGWPVTARRAGLAAPGDSHGRGAQNHPPSLVTRVTCVAGCRSIWPGVPSGCTNRGWMMWSSGVCTGPDYHPGGVTTRVTCCVDHR